MGSNQADLGNFFNPGSIAIVGVSSKADAFGGGMFLRRFRDASFGGALYPIHPKADEIEGFRAYPNLSSLPEVPELVILAVKAEGVPPILEECARVGARHIHIFASGFSEIGTREGAELEERIAALRELTESGAPEAEEIETQIRTLEEQADDLQRELYADLDVWKKVQLSRHPDRPYMLDYTGMLFEDFVELHGDRAFRDDPAIISGFARFDDDIVAVVGHQKGRTAKDKALRNFGMAHPEGYRKAIRVMKLAEQAGRPIFTFIDTPGAYPGLGAEERGQAEAIGHSIDVMSQLRVPIISTVLGEGGSGGALAIGVANRVLMLEYATYSVITPEGCASILWRDGARAPDAAEQLKLLARDAKRLAIIDDVVAEPASGAHRKPRVAAAALREALRANLSELQSLSGDELVAQRYQRFRALGSWQ